MSRSKNVKEDKIDVDVLKEKLIQFAKERDWEKFHNPKNLAMALSVECSELLEIFQWATFEEAILLKDHKKKKQAISDELSDILVYTIRLATLLEINLAQSLKSKMLKNAKKYPPQKVYGKSKKYNEY